MIQAVINISATAPCFFCNSSQDFHISYAQNQQFLKRFFGKQEYINIASVSILMQEFKILYY